MDHEHNMSLALNLAREAEASGEVPVGCVITDKNGKVIGTGRNRREHDKNAAAHAEIEAIQNACATIGDWRLTGCSLYVTLEPCPMCAGAVVVSRLSDVFYGARDPLTGSCGSVINLFMEPYGHSVRVVGGILEEQCAAVLSGFFAGLRSSFSLSDAESDNYESIIIE